MNLLVICYNFRHTLVFYSDFFSPHREIRFRKMCLPDFNPHERSWQQRCGLLLSVLWQLVCTCVYLCAHTGAATLERGDVAVGGGNDAASFCPYCGSLCLPVLTCVYLCTYLCARTGAATLERGDVSVGGGNDAASFCPYCGSLCLPVLTCTYLCARIQVRRRWSAATWR